MVEMTGESGEKPGLGGLTGTEFVGSGGQLFLGSEYRNRLLAAITISGFGERYPERMKMARRVVDYLHEQAAMNLKALSSEKFPGVKEVNTQISILDLITQTSTNTHLRGLAVEAKRSDRLSEEVWVLSSSAPVRGVDGGPYTAFEMALDVTLRKVPEVVRRLKLGEAVDMRCVCLGSPIAGGELTPEWVERVKKVGIFMALAELHAEMLETLGNSQVRRVVCFGHSFGGVLAELTARQFSQNVREKTTVLADSPAPTEEDSKLMEKVIREGLKVLPVRVQDMVAKATIDNSWERQLARAGIVIDCSPKQSGLRAAARKLVMEQVKKGSGGWQQLMKEDSGLKRNWVRIGRKDSLVPEDFKRVATQILSGGHAINRVRNKDGRRILRMAGDLV